MRRAFLTESEIDRLVDLAHDAGVSLRVITDGVGEATFAAGELGTFGDVASLERALNDALRSAA